MCKLFFLYAAAKVARPLILFDRLWSELLIRDGSVLKSFFQSTQVFQTDFVTNFVTSVRLISIFFLSFVPKIH